MYARSIVFGEAFSSTNDGLGLELRGVLAGQRQRKVSVGASPQQQPRRHRPVVRAGQPARMFKLLLGQLQMKGGLGAVGRAHLFCGPDRARAILRAQAGDRDDGIGVCRRTRTLKQKRGERYPESRCHDGLLGMKRRLRPEQ